jgi:uncharacterized protein (TIGR03000 family)
MYSLVMLAALSAGTDVPKHGMCPITPSTYGLGLFSRHPFLDCCAPARYGWVTCWTKGFGVYPGDCMPHHASLYRPPACTCAPCGVPPGDKCSGWNWCGYGWPIGDQPAYYTSVLGCPPHLTAPPYAYYTETNPCCRYGHFAFDSGLIGHSHGVGYSGFGGYGNFGYYAAVPMQHRPTTADLPPFPRPEYRRPGALPTGPAPMPEIPMGATPAKPKADPKKSDEKKDKVRLHDDRPAPATIVLSVPAGATVTVEGHALQSTGDERTFRTPPLDLDQSYAYTIRATLPVAGGRELAQTLEVRVTAGQTTRASFDRLTAIATDGSSRSTAGR